MYLNNTNMYHLGFNGLIEFRLLNVFEPGVCTVITRKLSNSVLE